MVRIDESRHLPDVITDEIAFEFSAHAYELGREGVPISWIMVFRLEEAPFTADAIRAIIADERELAEKIWQRVIHPDYW